MSALKLKRRPPLTTFAQRLMNTTFSVVSPLAAELLSVWRSCRLPPALCGCAMILLKFESAVASSVCQCFHFSMIQKAATVEDDFVDFLRKKAFGDCLAHLLGRR